MVKTAADGVFMVGFLMIIPVHAFLFADYFKYRLRLLLITVFLLGSLGSLVWLVTKFGMSDSWHALGEVQHKGFMGWVFTLMVFMAAASPLIAAWEYRAARHDRAQLPGRHQTATNKPSPMVRHETNLKAAPGNQLWLWAFVTTGMTVVLMLVSAVVMGALGHWGASIISIGIAILFALMVYLRLRIVSLIMHRSYPAR